MQHSIAAAIASAMATGTATAGLGTKGRPSLDQKLVHRPLHLTTTVATPPSTTAAPTTTTIATSETAVSGIQLEKVFLANAPVAKQGGGEGERPCLDSKLDDRPLNVTTSSTVITITEDSNAATVPTTPATPSITTTTTAATPTETIPTAPTESQLEKIPVDILLDIALLLLSRKDFASLLQTCRYVYYSLDTHWVWHQRFLLRIGNGLLMSFLNPRDPNSNELLGGKTEEDTDTSVFSKEELNKWYYKFARDTVPPKDMGISHLDNGYWELMNHPQGPYRQVATLKTAIAWLNVRATLFGVLPGRYWVQWGFSLTSPSAVVGTQFRVATFSRDVIPLWYNEIENSIDYTPPTFRRFLHHTNATNKDTVSREEAIIFQLPRVLVVKEDKPTVFVQMREHNGFKDGIAVLFVRLVPAKEDDEDIKAEREDVEGEDDAEMEWDESQEAVDYEWGDDDHDNEEQEQEQEEEEEQDEDESENDGSAAGYGEESEGLEDDDNEEGGDEDVNTGGENSIVGDNGVSIVDGHSSAPPSPHGDEEEDYDARPYFIRLSGRSHHH